MQTRWAFGRVATCVKQSADATGFPSGIVPICGFCARGSVAELRVRAPAIVQAALQHEPHLAPCRLGGNSVRSARVKQTWGPSGDPYAHQFCRGKHCVGAQTAAVVKGQRGKICKKCWLGIIRRTVIAHGPAMPGVHVSAAAPRRAGRGKVGKVCFQLGTCNVEVEVSQSGSSDV